MLHLIYFITRKQNLTDAAFHDYWRTTHGPIVKKIPQLQGYIQSHALAGTNVNTTYDGAAEAWVSNHQKLDELRRAPEFLQGALADEPNFIDMNRVEWLVTRDRVIIDGPQTPTMVKTISRLRRRPGMSVAEFREHWRDVHGPIARALPGIVRYVQCETVDEAYRYAEPRWDGVSQLWVENLDALTAMRASSAYTNDAMADAEKFLDLDSLSVFAATETQMIWPLAKGN